MTDNRGQKTEVRGQITDNRIQLIHLHAQSAGPAVRTEASDLSSVFCHLLSVICLLPPETYIIV